MKVVNSAHLSPPIDNKLSTTPNGKGAENLLAQLRPGVVASTVAQPTTNSDVRSDLCRDDVEATKAASKPNSTESPELNNNYDAEYEPIGPCVRAEVVHQRTEVVDVEPEVEADRRTPSTGDTKAMDVHNEALGAVENIYAEIAQYHFDTDNIDANRLVTDNTEIDRVETSESRQFDLLESSTEINTAETGAILRDKKSRNANGDGTY